MAVKRIPIIPCLVGALFWAVANSADAARDRRIQKQDRSRQMRVLVGDLDRLASMTPEEYAQPAAAARMDAAVSGFIKTYDEVGVKLKPVRQQKIRRQLDDVVKTYQAKKPIKVTAAKAKQTRAELLDALKVNLAPAITPEFAKGAAVYKEHCVTCHGSKGQPPEMLAKKLHPPPTDLSQQKNMRGVGPFRVFNDLMVGVPGTAKKPFADLLADEELWSVAFYSVALRHLGDASATIPDYEKMCKSWPTTEQPSAADLEKLSLVEVSRLSDQEISARFKQNDRVLGYIRLCLPFAGSLRR